MVVVAVGVDDGPNGQRTELSQVGQDLAGLAELGGFGLSVPEEFGGSGYGYIELIVILEEMGRSLLCAPYFSTVVLAANAVPPAS